MLPLTVTQKLRYDLPAPIVKVDWHTVLPIGDARPLLIALLFIEFSWATAAIVKRARTSVRIFFFINPPLESLLALSHNRSFTLTGAKQNGKRSRNVLRHNKKNRLDGPLFNARDRV